MNKLQTILISERYPTVAVYLATRVSTGTSDGWGGGGFKISERNVTMLFWCSLGLWAFSKLVTLSLYNLHFTPMKHLMEQLSVMETEEKLSAKRKRCQVFEEISCHILLPPLLCVLEQVVLSDPVKSDACQYEVRSVEIPSFSDEISSLGLTKSFQQLRKCCEEAANLSDEFVKIRPRSLRRNHFLAEFKNIHLYSLNQIGRGWTPRQWSVHSRSMLAPSRNENVAEENQKFPSANEKCTGKPTDGIKDGGSSNNDAPTRKSLPPVAKKIMFRWFEEHKHNPYPTSSEKDALVLQCGIRKEQVEYWFKNARARYLRKFLDENE